MKLKLLFSFLFFALFSASNSLAQTTLTVGDIAITGFKTDNPDQFVFVLLTEDGIRLLELLDLAKER